MSVSVSGVRIRSITREVAAAVVKQAVEEDVAEGYQKTEGRHLRAMTEVRGWEWGWQTGLSEGKKRNEEMKK